MTWLERLKVIWRILWRGETVPVRSLLEERIEELTHTDLTGAVKLAFDKLKNEPNYPGRPRMYDMGSGSEKRREVCEWVYRYAHQMGIDPISEWHVNFMIELLVGQDKGRL